MHIGTTKLIINGTSFIILVVVWIYIVNDIYLNIWGCVHLNPYI